MSGEPLHLFEAVGIELEYMIVDSATLAVKPIADRLLLTEAGICEAEIAHGDIAWSNELVLHVIELKTDGPVPTLEGLTDRFQEHVREINARLAPLNACLMPTGMHPTMDPARETVLWPHEYGPVYQALHRIFHCEGHGWANLQAMHINLPFADDAEFARLHAAIRLVLPIAPGLAASSPVVNGRMGDNLDTRMAVYRTNAASIPTITGSVIPEAVRNQAEYRAKILEPIYADLAPHDPGGVLRHEWVNARGAIARFDRQSIEIRVLDVQECPYADLAVAAAVILVVTALAGGTVSAWEAQNELPTETLAQILSEVTSRGDSAVVEDTRYLEVLGAGGRGAWRVGELWDFLLETHRTAQAGADAWRPAWDVILEQGCLARRIAARLHRDGTRAVTETYTELCRCLQRGELFV